MTAPITGPVVVGIDPSLTATGIAVVPREGAPRTATVRSTGRTADTLAVRHDRLVGIAQDVVETAHNLIDEPIALVVIEGPSHGSQGGAAWDRAHLWWRIVGWWLDRDVPVAVCAPATRIKWATGSGKASASTKSDVAVALARLWPDVDANGDGEWDALCLATIAAQHLGWPAPSRAHHAASVAKMTWAEATT